MAHQPQPKFYSFREVELWKHRFDPERPLTLPQIEEEFGIDRSAYASIQEKILWNLEHRFLVEETQALLEPAQRLTEVVGEITPELLDIIVRTRAHQVNWEIQRARYLARNQ